MTSRNRVDAILREFPRLSPQEVTQNLETALIPVVMTAIMCELQMALPARPVVIADAIGGPNQDQQREVTIPSEVITDQQIVDLTMMKTTHVSVTTDLVKCDLLSLAHGIADAVVRSMAELQMIRGNARLQLQLFSGAVQGGAGFASDEVVTQPATLAHLLRAKANGTATDAGDAILFEAAAVVLERTRIVKAGSLDRKDK